MLLREVPKDILQGFVSYIIVQLELNEHCATKLVINCLQMSSNGGTSENYNANYTHPFLKLVSSTDSLA